MKHHILTTGISLLENFRRAQTPPLSVEDAIRHNKRLRQYLDSDAKAASAEINSLQNRTNFLHDKSKSLEVTLIYTTTPAGKLVFSLLNSYLKGKVAQVHSIPIKGFDAPHRSIDAADAQETAAAALSQMRVRVAEHIAKMQKQSAEIELNCTGGFKAEVAILYELGRTLRVPVYYLHESFKVCITLP
jgi:putative CRISPR-associated protein (TIGR02619 family)